MDPPHGRQARNAAHSGGNHQRNRAASRCGGSDSPSGSADERQGGSLPKHGAQRDQKRHLADGRFGFGSEAGGADDERSAVRLPRAGRREYSRCSELLWHGAEDAGRASQAVYERNYLDDQVANHEPQSDDSKAVSRSDRPHCALAEDVRRRRRAEEAWLGAL